MFPLARFIPTSCVYRYGKTLPVGLEVGFVRSTSIDDRELLKLAFRAAAFVVLAVWLAAAILLRSFSSGTDSPSNKH